MAAGDDSGAAAQVLLSGVSSSSKEKAAERLSRTVLAFFFFFFLGSTLKLKVNGVLRVGAGEQENVWVLHASLSSSSISQNISPEKCSEYGIIFPRCLVKFAAAPSFIIQRLCRAKA